MWISGFAPGDFPTFCRIFKKMWDNIPFEIQENILKRLPIKSLLHFRSVSKACKSVIGSSAFIADYQHTELQQHILVRYDLEHIYVSIADDDTFPHQKVSLTAPMSFKRHNNPEIVGCSQGLFCFYDFYGNKTAVIWNSTIRKSVAIDVPNVLNREKYSIRLGFGVCPHTLDPMLVKISIKYFPGGNKAFTDTIWRVEIFRLSSGAWKSLSKNLPRTTIVLKENYVQVIDRFIYWLAFDWISRSNLIISFDMISEIFTEISLPDNLALNRKPEKELYLRKFNGSLVVLEDIYYYVDVPEYGVWIMENGDLKSFIKLYTIRSNLPDKVILDAFGFRKSGEVLIEAAKRFTSEEDSELLVYDPKSEHVDFTGISSKESSFFVSAYTETLLLLDH